MVVWRKGKKEEACGRARALLSFFAGRLSIANARTLWMRIKSMAANFGSGDSGIVLGRDIAGNGQSVAFAHWPTFGGSKV